MPTNASDRGRRAETVGVTGHRALPVEAVDFLHRRMAELFPDGTGLTVACSLAEGADSLVAEHILSVGGRLNVVVPCADYGTTFADGPARRRYSRLLARAAAVTQLPFDSPSEEAFLQAGYRVVTDSDWILAVWDGQAARGRGGTADIVRRARDEHKPVEVLWPPGLSR